MLKGVLKTLGLSLPSCPSREEDYEPILSPIMGRSRQASLTDDQPRRHSRRRSSSMTTGDEPDSRISWSYYVLGAASLLSWNALITAFPYFLSRLDGSKLKNTFPSYFSATYTLVSSIAFAHATLTAKQADASSRFRRALFWIMGLLLLLALSPFVPTAPSTFFAFALFDGVLQAGAGAYFQTSVVALASMFGPFAIQAVFAGQAAVGVFVSVVQYITAAVSVMSKPSSAALDPTANDHASTAAFLFFGISTLFLVLTLVVHGWLVRLPAYIERNKALGNARTQGVYVEEEEEEPEGLGQGMAGSAADDRLLVGMEVPATQRVGILSMARLNGAYNFSVCYVFIVSLAVFPAITSSIQSIHQSEQRTPLIFSPILFTSLHFLTFNIGDYLGRAICSFPHLIVWSRKRLLGLSLARTIFIPIFLACNIQRTSLPTIPAVAPLVNSDAGYLFILLLFGISNGYVATSGIMAASSTLHNPRLRAEDADTAATVAQFFLVSGLTLGSVASFGVRASICDCNPFQT
ncbi:hypothetical protein FRB95_013360 [Tulasnella sp. JGI-2019a]|nr:hypothetical protein FRB95_013360 [Tulasnella sp. JGI-2019a]